VAVSEKLVTVPSVKHRLSRCNANQALLQRSAAAAALAATLQTRGGQGGEVGMRFWPCWLGETSGGDTY
jgi:hypothetical protein